MHKIWSFERLLVILQTILRLKETVNMNKIKIIAALVCIAGVMTSCIKDEEQNKECDIESAWIEDENIDKLFYLASDTKVTNITSTTSEITFTVRTMEYLPELAVFFKLTPGATISPANGSKQDFKKGPVTYTVTSEDGQWHRDYKVKCQEADLPFNECNFENFDVVETKNYHSFWEQSSKGEKLDIWSSGNEGYHMLLAAQSLMNPDMKITPDLYPTCADPDGYKGNCVKLTTMSTGELGALMNKPIASGNLFLGSFDVNKTMTNPVEATRMGVVYTHDPIRVAGYYKYKPGTTYTDKNGNTIDGKVDKPFIYSVLYKREFNEENEEIPLYGSNVLTSPRIVRKAVAQYLPATDKWKRFEMFFEGDAEVTKEDLEARKYNLAFVIASSYMGDQFEGAVGSTLWVDELDISYKK